MMSSAKMGLVGIMIPCFFNYTGDAAKVGKKFQGAVF